MHRLALFPRYQTCKCTICTSYADLFVTCLPPFFRPLRHLALIAYHLLSCFIPSWLQTQTNLLMLYSGTAPPIRTDFKSAAHLAIQGLPEPSRSFLNAVNSVCGHLRSSNRHSLSTTHLQQEKRRLPIALSHLRRPHRLVIPLHWHPLQPDSFTPLAECRTRTTIS